MLGTKKQVKWANEIRTNIVKTFQAIITEFAPMADMNERVRKNIASTQARIDQLNTEDIHASDIIDLFKDVKFSGDHHEDFKRLISVYRVSIPNTTGQHAILMRQRKEKNNIV